MLQIVQSRVFCHSANTPVSRWCKGWQRHVDGTRDPVRTGRRLGHLHDTAVVSMPWADLSAEIERAGKNFTAT